VRLIVRFGSVLLLVALSMVIGSSMTASALVKTSASSFAVQPTSVNFGDTPDNTTASIPVVVTIDAGYEFSDPMEPVEWGEFSPASGGCDGFVGPGTCLQDLTFSPTSTGDQTNVFEIDEVPANGAPGSEQSIYVDESGYGVTCPTADTSDLLTAYSTDGTFNGMFCLNSSGAGSYTQGAFDGAPSVSGAAVVDLPEGPATPLGAKTTSVGAPAVPVTTYGGGTGTIIYAVGPDLLLAGSSTGGGNVGVANPVPATVGQKPLEPIEPIASASRFEEDAPLHTAGSFTLELPLACLSCVPG
jgi:hypothetical protein